MQVANLSYDRLINTLLKKKNRLFPRSHADSADRKCGAFGDKPNVKRFTK
jgi:hypothetical protein